MSPAVSPVAQALSPAPAWPCRLVAHARLAVSHVQTLFLPRRPGLLHRVAPARSAMSPALNPVALALSPRTAAPRPFVDTTLCRPWPVNRAALSRFTASPTRAKSALRRLGPLDHSVAHARSPLSRVNPERCILSTRATLCRPRMVQHVARACYSVTPRRLTHATRAT
ncbi:hypothetical protein K438DRAFT_1971920 [Mycena galopus ATCC 62051]|nr:hypothetical protein K438DRAFT_1971920 [Mycena galopus ATCC 62051]